MSENSWKTPNAILGIIGALVAAAGLYLGYLQFVKPPVDPPPVVVDTPSETAVDKKNRERIEELNKKIYDYNQDIEKYQTRQTNMEAEASVLYQDDTDPNDMPLEKLRDLNKRRDDAEGAIDEVKNIISELKHKRDSVQNKLDGIGN